MDAVTLARDALAALAAHGDPRARECLAHAAAVLEPGVRRWTASGGDVHGHRVRLRVDARALGLLHGHPAAADALQTAFARAVAAHAGQSLADFRLEWSGAVATVVTTYRGELLRAGEAELTEALRAYLDGAGEPVPAGLAVSRTAPDAVAVTGVADERVSLVRAALRALLGEGLRVTSS